MIPSGTSSPTTTRTAESDRIPGLTRGRHTNLAVIPDVTGTLGPADVLTDMIARTPRHGSALAVRNRLHQEAAVPEPPDDCPAVSPIIAHQAAKVRAIQQRLDAFQAPRSGRGLGR